MPGGGIGITPGGTGGGGIPGGSWGGGGKFGGPERCIKVIKINLTKLTYTCSKSRIDTIEKGVKHVQ